MENEWLTTEEVMEYLKVSRITVYRYISKGIIRRHKIGRFNRYRKSEIEAAVKETKGGAGSV